jgi:hypothetical protein
MTMKKQCETGCNAETALESVVTPAIADRKSRCRKPSRTLAAKMLAGSTDYVGTLPPPPIKQTDYVRCIAKWMRCYEQGALMNQRQDQIAYTQAALAYVAQWPHSSYRDAYRAYLQQQIATLQTQQAQQQVVLTALVGAYLDCMVGTPI